MIQRVSYPYGDTKEGEGQVRVGEEAGGTGKTRGRFDGETGGQGGRSGSHLDVVEVRASDAKQNGAAVAPHRVPLTEIANQSRIDGGSCLTSDVRKAYNTPLAVTQIQASRLLGVTDRTIRRWDEQGILTGNRVGGVKLYPYERLKELATGKVN